MKLHKLKIEGFRKIKEAEITFGDATFLIGENNVGKSTILSAIDILLSDKKNLDDFQYSKQFDLDSNEDQIVSDSIVFTAEFRNVPLEIVNYRGFSKQRLISYTPEEEGDSGLSVIYRKTFNKGNPVIIEMQLSLQEKKENFSKCKKPIDYYNEGVDGELLKEIFGEDNFEKNISKKDESLLEDISEIWDINEEEKVWISNPGGIVGNVLSKLPKFLLIPAEDKSSEIDKDRGAMILILKELFEEVREASDNYKEAQKYLNLLASELNPQDEKKEFGIMMNDLNEVIDGVFPNAKINVTASLSDPNNVLKPEFLISMSSNISSPIQYQGTGMIRAAVFSLLRFKHKREDKNSSTFKRGLIIGFEEPEIYLHPNAANKMRDTIYELACDNTQIICTTHSPYMIDLSKKPKQILNNLKINENDFVNIIPFNITDEFKRLHENEQSYIKMLQKMDDYIARVFFAKHVIIVEGDTDEIVLKRTIELMPLVTKNNVLSDFQIIKATGKAAIIPLVKYLRAMEVDIFVVHDRDNQTAGATKFNEPILDAVGDEKKILQMKECIEDELGYQAPNYNKPYKAYEFTKQWENWENIPKDWRDKMKLVFDGYIE